jgi:hypothetical protein
VQTVSGTAIGRKFQPANMRNSPHHFELHPTNAELQKIKTSIREIDSQIIDLTTSIAQALAERDGRQAANSPKHPKPSAIWTPVGQQEMKPVTAASLLMRAQRKQSTRRNPALNPDDCFTPKETPNVQITTSSNR